MTSKPLLSDDYIAALLSQEASEFVKSPYVTKKTPVAQDDVKRKPNTRFLRNLIGETVSYNKALLAKESKGPDPSRDSERRKDTKKERERERDRARDHRHSREHSRKHRRSRTRSRSRSPSRSRHGHRSRHRSRDRSSHHRRRRKSIERSNTTRTERNKSRSRSSSDPLEDIVGPKPPPKARGRGVVSLSTGLDAKFDPSYDPSTDIQPDFDEERDDWDNALEALKDQRAWQQKQKERMREAGFTASELQRWEKPDRREVTGDIRDVKWSKQGEDREWDKGKKIEDPVDLEYGRLSRD
jgi:hypothetical protein